MQECLLYPDRLFYVYTVKGNLKKCPTIITLYKKIFSRSNSLFTIRDIIIVIIRVKNIKFFGLLCLSVILLLGFMSAAYSGSTYTENKTLMQLQAVQGIATNATNIVLVHGFWADGSSWSKVIPILENAGHQVVAVQLPLHSLADDVATTTRAVEQLGGPTIIVQYYRGNHTCLE